MDIVEFRKSTKSYKTPIKKDLYKKTSIASLSKWNNKKYQQHIKETYSDKKNNSKKFDLTGKKLKSRRYNKVSF